MSRLFKTVANPFSRTALIMFAWTHRRTIMRWGRSFWTELTQPGRIGRSVAEVGAIVEAIAAKDPDAADAACRDHIERAAGAALARLSEEVHETE